MNGFVQFEPGRFTCPVDGCNRRFATVHDKKLHVRTIHPDTMKKAKR